MARTAMNWLFEIPRNLINIGVTAIEPIDRLNKITFIIEPLNWTYHSIWCLSNYSSQEINLPFLRRNR